MQLHFHYQEQKRKKPLFAQDNKVAMTKEQQILVFKEALRLTDDQFQKKYKFSHPKKDQVLIFYSSTGVRSDSIAEVALNMGYNAKSLLGGSRLWNKFYGPNDTTPIPNRTLSKNISSHVSIHPKPEKTTNASA